MELSFGEKLRVLRISKCLSQYQLAVLLGVYPSQISRLESGKQKCSKPMAIAVAVVLEVDPYFFVKKNNTCL